MHASAQGTPGIWFLVLDLGSCSSPSFRNRDEASGLCPWSTGPLHPILPISSPGWHLLFLEVSAYMALLQRTHQQPTSDTRPHIQLPPIQHWALFMSCKAHLRITYLCFLLIHCLSLHQTISHTGRDSVPVFILCLAHRNCSMSLWQRNEQISKKNVLNKSAVKDQNEKKI